MPPTPSPEPARPAGLRRLGRLLPDLEEDLLLNLFHKGAKVQWTSEDLEWAPPLRLSDRQRLALARLLTPVYFGEQTAMLGASGILPEVFAARETTMQLYLSSFMMDEARHFEALTRLYHKLGHDPIGLRQMPELLRYHHRIRQGDRADWVWGILFSDVIAKHFYRSFGVAQADPLFGAMSQRILLDESRHLAFADHYLRRNVPLMSPARRQALIDMRDDLYRLLSSMTERVRSDGDAFGVDGDDYLGRVWTDVESFGRRIGLVDSDDEPPAGPADAGETAGETSAPAPAPTPAPDPPPAASAATARKFSISMPRCFGCLLTLLCGRRLARA
ncbi:MAG TPA: diiron oxygenase [Candidatus Dormibacteraeota bacterium]